VLKAWAHQTIAGRVVYNRREHPFTVIRCHRILMKINNRYAVGSPGFGDYWAWSSVAGIAARNAAVLLYAEARTEASGMSNETLSFLRPIALFIYYLEQALSIASHVFGKMPIVQSVWAIGEIIINALISRIKGQLPTYYYSTRYKYLYFPGQERMPADA
jgi:hypothetical protein